MSTESDAYQLFRREYKLMPPKGRPNADQSEWTTVHVGRSLACFFSYGISQIQVTEDNDIPEVRATILKILEAALEDP